MVVNHSLSSKSLSSAVVFSLSRVTESRVLASSNLYPRYLYIYPPLAQSLPAPMSYPRGQVPITHGSYTYRFRVWVNVWITVGFRYPCYALVDIDVVVDCQVEHRRLSRPHYHRAAAPEIEEISSEVSDEPVVSCRLTSTAYLVGRLSRPPRAHTSLTEILPCEQVGLGRLSQPLSSRESRPAFAKRRRNTV
ncbi:hypothetical protein BC629DRAFT_477345 [Irpex lacteus]|nr:hypothetical protein BC629DRAFT_477345 [Irpex lacteus]